ncbi:MAG: hypothetical protein OXR66_01865 [Candidatus Woesearchaeota archaeon]|nr:hypothetical protein [Candidatus Woesearchaeota archaeon]
MQLPKIEIEFNPQNLRDPRTLISTIIVVLLLLFVLYLPFQYFTADGTKVVERERVVKGTTTVNETIPLAVDYTEYVENPEAYDEEYVELHGEISYAKRGADGRTSYRLIDTAGNELKVASLTREQETIFQEQEGFFAVTGIFKHRESGLVYELIRMDRKEQPVEIREKTVPTKKTVVEEVTVPAREDTIIGRVLVWIKTYWLVDPLTE